ncbi:MAG: choice-of-anchor Q domain-containing protein [Pirellulales bacterium]
MSHRTRHDWLRSKIEPSRGGRSASSLPRGATFDRRLRIESLEDRRLLAAGALDTTFDFDGLVVTNIGTQPRSEDSPSVAVQADGKIVVAGSSYNGNPYDSDFAVARYNVDGSLDTTFDDDGKLTTDLGSTGDSGYSVAVQADGKIIVAGTSNNDDFAVVRYNTDGKLDTTFDGDGKVTTDFGSFSGGYGMTLQADGKIIVVGVSNNDFAVVRYNTNGTLDTTFDGDGKLATDIGASASIADYATSVVVQGDDKIVVAGAGGYGIAVVRYNANGTLDATFDDDGKLTTDLGPFSYGNSVAMQDDGKIVVAGGTDDGSEYDFAVVRYDTNGALDTSFDDDGKLTTDFGALDEYGYSVAVQADGKIVVVGESGSDLAVVRYNTNGILDTTFDGDGKMTMDVGSGFDQANSVAVQADGKLVLAARSFHGNDLDFAVVRYDSSGVLDTGFGDGGIVITDFAFVTLDDQASDVAMQADGKTVVVGLTSNPGLNDNFVVARYNVDGSLDTSFDGDGVITADFGGARDAGHAVAIQADGKIIVVGRSGNGSSGNFALARFLSDGQLDASFGVGGKVTTDFFGEEDSAYDVALQSDGRIVVVGDSRLGGNADFAAARYNTNGSLDTSFDGDGKVRTGVAGADFGRSVAIHDGRIVVAGLANSGSNWDFGLVRYNANGSLDTSFAGDGIQTTALGSASDQGYSVAVRADGKIFVAGESVDGSGNVHFALARYNSNGALDTSWAGGDGFVTTGFTGTSQDRARGMALQANGKIVLAGYTNNGGNLDIGLVRYNADGTLDTSFDGDGRATTAIGFGEDSAVGVTIQSDGKLVVAGQTHNGNDYDFAVARYEGDSRSVQTFVVDTLVDESDDNYSVGDSSLREAILLANSNLGFADTIEFAASLTSGGSATILLALGELQIRDSVTISGPGANLLTIDASGNDPTPNTNNGDGNRIFSVDDGDGSADKFVSMIGLTMAGGDVGSSGGAIFNREKLTISECTISGNAAVNLGGGVFNRGGDFTAITSTISDNEASIGGGIQIDFGHMTLTNVTVSGNRSKADGGGLHLRMDHLGDTTTISHSTITGNEADSDSNGNGGGGGIYVFPATLGVATLDNTIIAGNLLAASRSDIAHAVSVRYSLIGDDSGAAITDNGGNVIGTFGSPINPMLGPLGFNGGPTMTHALLIGSPAFNAGDPTAMAGVGDVPQFDQRGAAYSRVVEGRIDIGAFEASVPVNLVVDTLEDENDGNYGAGGLSLREAIGLANGSVGSDTIEFALTLDGGTIQLTRGQIQVSEALSIDASSLIQGLTIDANAQSRILEIVATTGDFTLSGLTLTNASVSEVLVAEGGAIRSLTAGTLALIDCDINQSEVEVLEGFITPILTAVGGAVFALGDVILTRCVISDNVAIGTTGSIPKNIAVAGGIYSGQRVTLIETLVSANAAIALTSGLHDDRTEAFGGGLFAQHVVLVNSTVSGNFILSSFGVGVGGGISAAGLTIRHSTITGNDVSAVYAAGGGIRQYSASAVEISNSIISGNSSSGTAPDLLVETALLTINYSLIGNTAGSGINQSMGVGNMLNVDAMLEPLTDNGGPTRTHALLPGSPAIDAGDPAAVAGSGDVPEFDQRGESFTRVLGGRIDIGSFEIQAPQLIGDYNGDGTVNAADYTVWRDTLSSTTDLRANGNDSNNLIDTADYSVWTANFGEMLAVGASEEEREASAIEAAFALFDHPRITLKPLRTGGLSQSFTPMDDNALLLLAAFRAEMESDSEVSYSAMLCDEEEALEESERVLAALLVPDLSPDWP